MLYRSSSYRVSYVSVRSGMERAIACQYRSTVCFIGLWSDYIGILSVLVVSNRLIYRSIGVTNRCMLLIYRYLTLVIGIWLLSSGLVCGNSGIILIFG